MRGSFEPMAAPCFDFKALIRKDLMIFRESLKYQKA
jgi:hypothetical protein